MQSALSVTLPLKYDLQERVNQRTKTNFATATYFRALTKKSGKLEGFTPNEVNISPNVAEAAVPLAYTDPVTTSFHTSVANTFPVLSV